MTTNSEVKLETVLTKTKSFEPIPEEEDGDKIDCNNNQGTEEVEGHSGRGHLEIKKGVKFLCSLLM